MDSITTYKYAYGDLNSIKRGEFDKMQTGNSIEELSLYEATSKGILLPRVVGVYQEWKFIPESEDEKEKSESMNSRKESLEDSFLRLQTELVGHNDRFNNYLIHLGYDSKTYPSKELLRQIFDEEFPSRIRISSYNKMPDLGMKDVGYIDESFDEEMKVIIKARDMREMLELTRPVTKKDYEVLRKQLEEFGLTKMEYHLFNLVNMRLNAGLPKKEIILPPKEVLDNPLIKKIITELRQD